MHEAVEAAHGDLVAGLAELLGVGLAFVPQRIETGGDDERAREPAEVFAVERVAPRIWPAAPSIIKSSAVPSTCGPPAMRAPRCCWKRSSSGVIFFVSWLRPDASPSFMMAAISGFSS